LGHCLRFGLDGQREKFSPSQFGKNSLAQFAPDAVRILYHFLPFATMQSAWQGQGQAFRLGFVG